MVDVHHEHHPLGVDQLLVPHHLGENKLEQNSSYHYHLTDILVSHHLLENRLELQQSSYCEIFQVNDKTPTKSLK